MTTPRTAALLVFALLAAHTASAQAVKGKTKTKTAKVEHKTKHVVIVILGGGVRAKDVFGRKDDCPNLNRIAAAGVTATMKTRDVGSYGSAVTLLTGVDQPKLADTDRADVPTIFELVRRTKRLASHETWVSAAGSDWHTYLAFSGHQAYGVKYAANYISGEGAFTSELADVTNQFGEPRVPDSTEKSLLEKLQSKVDPTNAKKASPESTGKAAAELQERIRKYVLDELSGRVKKIEAPGLKDIQAIHYGTNILAVFKPTLLCVATIYHDLGRNNFDRYQQVLRKNDEEIGRLYDAILNDPELAGHTALVIVPDFGRNERLNAKGGLDHDDKTKDHTEVFFIGWGPDFKKGKAGTIDSTDVAPTLLHLLGVPLRNVPNKTVGKVATDLLAGS